MAKLTRESRLRERRLDKQARKEARKQAAANPTDDLNPALTGEDDASASPDSSAAVQPGLEADPQALPTPDHA